MTVLVTGGAGYIGSHLVLALRDVGAQAVVLDNLSTGCRAAVPAEIPFFSGDVGDQDLVRKIVDEHCIDSVVHFAGSIIVPDSVADPLAYYKNNTVKSRALIEELIDCGVDKFIFSSTAAVYGTPDVCPIPESAALRPESPYGSSKLMTEIMLADAARAYGLRYIALRYFNVAGADPQGRSGQSSPRATHLIKIASQTATGKRPHMEIYGDDYPTLDGTCVRDYIHVSDLAQAHMVALDHLRCGGSSNVFNCGYGRGYSVLEVIDTVRRVSGKSFEARLAPRRPGDPASLVAESHKLQTELGWQPRLDNLDTIVAHALAWEGKLRPDD